MTVAIKVRCSACHSLSEVTSEALGGQVKCPFCDVVFDVAIDEKSVEPAPLDPAAPHPVELGKLVPAISFRLAWEIAKANFGILFVTHLVFFGSMVVVDVLRAVALESGNGGIGTLIQVVSMPIVLWVNIGLTKVTLQIARGIPTFTETLFSGANCLVRVLIFNVIFVILVGIGCVAFVVPGVYLMLRFWSGSYFIIDKDCSVSDAFRMASACSEGNKITSLQLGCLSFGLAILGLSFFVVGLVLAFPLINMMWTIAYMMMTRQPIQRANSAAS